MISLQTLTNTMPIVQCRPNQTASISSQDQQAATSFVVQGAGHHFLQGSIIKTNKKHVILS